MSTATVPRSATAPKPPAQVVDFVDRLRDKVLADVREKVDHLARLRDLLRQSERAERELTGEIVAALKVAGATELEGEHAVAILGERTTFRVDPALFHDAVGPRAFEAMTVSVTAARKFMGAEDLAAISEPTTAPVMRVEPLTDGKAVA